jgi:alpha-tubulin suppressor-like RCC1 family protein
VKCWGKNTRGQLGSGSSATRGIEESPFFAPDPQRATQQIIAANEYTCALLDDHSIKCWGDNTRGQLGYNDTTQRNTPDSQSLFLGAGRTALQIAAYHQHTCALLDDHSVKCWGDNSSGQLGYNDTAQRNAPPASPVNLGTGRTAKQIATGKAHTCALLDNNTVKCWGDNSGGQLGYGDTTQRNAPPVASVNLGTGRTAKQIAAASEHTCAILDNNTVKCWGKGIIGNGGNQQTIQSSPPANPINLGAGRTAISLVAGGAWTAACAFLDNNTVTCWGHKLSGNDPFDLLVGLPQTILRVNLHEHHICVTLAENKARCWGQNDDQQLGYNYPSGDSPTCTILGEICPNLDQTPILFAKKDRCNGVCTPIQENTAHCGTCQNICTPNDICARSRCASPALQLAMTDQTCILHQNHTLQCWDRFDAPSTLPIDVGAGRTVKHFALGGFASSHICALLDNDTVKCWGSNGRGQLGYNDTVYRPLPTQETLQFPAGRKVIQLAAASELSCALLDDESVRCWGRSTAYSSSPTTPINTLAPPTGAVNLGTGRTAKMLIGGFGRVCAILDDGTARCWSNRTESFHVGTGRRIKTLSSGTNLCAILDDDTAKCWGANDNPALLPPLDFGVGRTAKQLVTGPLHTCAILDNDHLVCWGNNSGGQLGYGDTTTRNSPPAIAVELGTGRKAIQIALGLSKTCALLDHHQLKCWGYEGLGYNDILQRNAPPSTVIRY